MKAATPVSDQARQAALKWLKAFPPQTQQRGRDLRARGAVSGVKVAHAGTTVQACVQGTYLYGVTLRHHRTSGWMGNCNCPVGLDCKHSYATMLAALDAWPESENGEKPPEEAPARAAKKKAGKFADWMAEKAGRPLTAPELNVAKLVDTLFRHRDRGEVMLSELRSATGSKDGWDWRTVQLWPKPPANAKETWYYLAAYLRREGKPLPGGLADWTDWPEVDALAGEWERSLKVAKWQAFLKSVEAAENHDISSPHVLRAKLEREGLLLEWQKNGAGEFTRISQNAFNQLLSDAMGGRLPEDESSVRIWRAFNTGYGAMSNVGYRLPDCDRILNLLLRDETLIGRVVGPKGHPLPRAAEPLKWQLEVSEGDRPDYRVTLVRADGTPPPPMLTAVRGRPDLYVSESGVFPTPPGARSFPRDVVMPAEAVENSTGVSVLEHMRLELPPRLAARVRTERLRLVFRCRLEPNQLDDNERLVVEALAENTRGEVVEDYQKEGWTPRSEALTPIGDEILRVDRTALAGAPELLAAIKPTWWPYDREWHKPVGKKFADQFSEWLTALPADVVLLLDPVLASFRDDPVRAMVKLEVEESGIDWFDLRIALDVADTTLTKAEIKALLDARGGFVRLGAKGWKRLRFDLSAEDEEQLADLGLAARDLDGGKQRLHALQLAGKTAAQRLIAQEHALKVERRAGEIRTRVAPEVSPALQAELRPYQIDGYHFLAYLSANRFGGILADDMGLGKTLQTLTWILWIRGAEGMTDPAHQKHPVLVVCPKSVVDNWRTEAARFAPSLRVTVVPRGADAKQLLAARDEADLVVMNYAQLRILEAAVTAKPWLAAVLDEAQAIKNPDSATARVAWSLKCAHRLALSGTPIENRLLDLWSIMQFAMPGVLGNKNTFGKTFDQRSDPFARRRLSARVRPFVLRRTKSEVATDLPERIEEDLLCELDGHQATLYRAELKRARAALLKLNTKADLDKARFNILTSLMRLRQICCHPALVGAKAGKNENEETPESAKLAALLDLVEPLMAEGHKVLIFSQFVQMLELIRAEFVAREWKHFLLTGATEERGDLVADFQSTEGAAAFLISLRAGGFGLNLTAASYVVLFDPWWNPAVENQAIDRTHRIGQRNTVIAYRLLMKETIEEKIRALQKQKSALASDVLGEEAFARTLTLEDFRFLFEE